MLRKKNKNLSRDPFCGDSVNWLDGSMCKDWVSEVTEETWLDSGWSMNHRDGLAVNMICIMRWVKPRKPFAEVAHYTIGNCCKDILGRDEVFCLRRRKGSKWAVLTTHIAGECPALIYIK